MPTYVLVYESNVLTLYYNPFAAVMVFSNAIVIDKIELTGALHLLKSCTHVHSFSQ